MTGIDPNVLIQNSLPAVTALAVLWWRMKQSEKTMDSIADKVDDLTKRVLENHASTDLTDLKMEVSKVRERLHNAESRLAGLSLVEQYAHRLQQIVKED